MSQVPATLHFGKEEITESWLEELRGQLKKRGTVKVRFTKAGRAEKSTKEWAQEIAARVGADVSDVRGFTVTFARGKAPRAPQRQTG